MEFQINIDSKIFTIDTNQPIDISIPLTDNEKNPIAWYIEKPKIQPVVFGDWIGKVSEGSSTNFNNILFNPHGHGTHTECLGHITREFYSINQCLKKFFFTALVISIEPELIDDDLVITLDRISRFFNQANEIIPEALIIRTLPNTIDKKSKNYSNTNPPYIVEEAATFIRHKGVKHLLVDLPSIDREKDEGKLLAHKAFWNVKDVNDLNEDARLDATITEMIFVPNEIQDGNYLLNLQIASFENDASPSKPVLYKLK